MLCLHMTRKRTRSSVPSHARKPLQTRSAPHSHNIFSSELRPHAAVFAENFPPTVTEPTLGRRTRHMDSHRRSSDEMRQRAQKRPRNPPIFSRLQRRVQLIETTRYQPASFHTHAHSSPVSPVFATLTQNTPGVWVPSRASRKPVPGPSHDLTDALHPETTSGTLSSDREAQPGILLRRSSDRSPYRFPVFRRPASSFTLNAPCATRSEIAKGFARI
jgi:hypothetical protein